MTELSANQLYKKSGSSLPFREWITREKTKGVFPLNQSANEDFEQSINADGFSSSSGSAPVTESKPPAISLGAVVIGVVVVGLAFVLLSKKKS